MIMDPIMRVKNLVPFLYILLLFSSCGSGNEGSDLPSGLPDTYETREDPSPEAAIPPGIHESSGFFPVEPGAVPLRFVVVGDMGGPVLYSSSTVPAWLSGKNAIVLGPDGRLATIPLDGSSSLYLPPDLAAFAAPGGLSLPVSICVTGPSTAVMFMDDKRLLGITNDTIVELRQFGTEVSGAVVISGSPIELVIADSYGKILAMDGQTAGTLWGSDGGPVLLSGGMAIYAGADSFLQIHEALDGRILARSDLAGFSASIKPTRDATRIFAALSDGRLVALDNAGKTLWIAETGIQAQSIMNDLRQVQLVSTELIAAFDKETGAELWRLPLPVPPGGDPVLLTGSIIYAGTDGRVYASLPDPEPVGLHAADPGERVTAVIEFRLEKYVRNLSGQLVTFMPYVEGAVHEGPSAFSVFAYGPVEQGGEYWLTWDGEDRDVVLALFNEQGDELRANLDEFGTHDSFSYRLDENGHYFIALGRQDPAPPTEPVFLSVIPARRK
jgi:outer membrane protein assembly factor BamB